jgi:plastocyanin
MRQHGPTGLHRLAAFVCLLLVAGMVGLAGSTAFAAGAQTVTIGASLSPQDITVDPGTTVTWTAADAGKHKIRSTSGPTELKSSDINQAQSWSFTFTAAGTYAYVDDENKDNAALHGTVTVGSAGTGPGAAPAPGAPGAPPAPATASVSLAGKAFSPASVTVAVGGVVTWTNNDSMPHNVTSNSGAFHSATLNPGQTFSFTFTAPGNYPYNCTFHGGMNGTVIVPTATGAVPAPAAAQAAPAAPNAPAAHAGPATASHGKTKTYRIQVKDNSFSPSSVHARVGDTISWVNVGAMPHTVTAGNGAFDHQLSPGQQFSYALRAKGTVPYVCSFHPGMDGSLVVGSALAGVKVPPKVADNGGGGATGGTAPAAAAPVSSGKTKTIEIKVSEMAFAPAMAKANVGDTISWINVGSIPHTVTAKDGSFDKTPLAPGQRFNYVLRKAGDISYVCSYHPGMDGMLMVGAALAGVAVPPASGTAGTKPLSKAPASSGTATTFEIQVKDSSFNPAMLQARVGDTISWVNIGKIVHTVTAKDHSFDKSLKPGQRFNLVLTKEGTIDYVCTPHPGMFGMLMVGPAGPGAKPVRGPTTLSSMSPVAMSGLGFVWLLIIGLLTSAQLRARIAPGPIRSPLRRRDASGDPEGPLNTSTRSQP